MDLAEQAAIGEIAHPRVSVVYLVESDTYMLISDDWTAGITLPPEFTTSIGELLKPKANRVINETYGQMIKPLYRVVR